MAEYFDQAFYLQENVTRLNFLEYQGRTDWTADEVLTLIEDSKFETARNHFDQFGFKAEKADGVFMSPSSGFDINTYIDANVNRLNDTEYQDRTDWTRVEVADLFSQANISPIDHYDRFKDRDDVAQSLDDIGFDPTPVAGSGEPGDTFTLTDGLDVIEGTTDDDTIKGVLDGAGNETTWNIVDEISDQGGTDTMNVRAVSTDADVSFAGRVTEGVEIFNFTHIDGSTGNNQAVEVDTNSLDGATQVWSVNGTAGGNDTLRFTNIAEGVTAGVEGGDEDLQVNHQFAAGTEATVALKGAELNQYKVQSADALEGVTVETAGSASELSNFIASDGDTVTTLNVLGNQDVDFGALTGLAGEVTIDAANLDASMTADLALSDDVEITGGQGAADTLIADVTGGDLSDDFTMSAVENLTVDTMNGGEEIDLTSVTGVETVGIRSNNNETLNVVEAPADTGVLFQGAGGDGANETVGSINFGFAGATADSPAESLAVAVDNQGTDPDSDTDEYAIQTGSLTANNVSDITVDAADADVDFDQIDADQLENLTIVAPEDFLFQTNEVGQNAAATFTSLDVSDVEGAFTATLVSNIQAGWDDTDNDVDTTYTYTGAQGVDTLTIEDQDLDTSAGDDKVVTLDVSTGAGADVVQVGSVGTNNDDQVLNLDLGAGNDELSANTTLTLGDGDHTVAFGAGTDTLTTANGAVDLSNASISGLENIVVDGADLSLAAADLIEGGTNDGDVTASVFTANYLYLAATDDQKNIDISGTDYDNVTIQGNENIGLAGDDQDNELIGDDNANIITGGEGNDNLTGNAGDDTFVFEGTASANGEDTITDFDGTSDNEELDIQSTNGLLGEAISAGSFNVDFTDGADSDLDLSGANNLGGVITSDGTIGTGDVVMTGNETTPGDGSDDDVVIADGGRGMVTASDGANGTSMNLYVVSDSDGDAGNGSITAEVQLVGTITIADYANIDGADFV